MGIRGVKLERFILDIMKNHRYFQSIKEIIQNDSREIVVSMCGHA